MPGIAKLVSNTKQSHRNISHDCSSTSCTTTESVCGEELPGLEVLQLLRSQAACLTYHEDGSTAGVAPASY